MAPPPALTSEELSPVAWRINTYSPNGGDSRVVAGQARDGSRRIAVRQSHQPTGTIQLYPAAALTAFLAAIEVGDVDLLAA